MDQLQCPHCLNAVPRGASVCIGCKAEVRYGTPGYAKIIAIILSFYLAYVAGQFAHDIWQPAGMPVLIIAFLVLIYFSLSFCKRFFADRVIFKRYYRR